MIKARKQVAPIINSDAYAGLSLFRPIQILNLVIQYELKDFDIITSQTRSIKRLNRIQKTSSRLEDIFFHFLGTDLISQTPRKKESLIKKINTEFDLIEIHNEDKTLLSIFDIKGWMLKYLGQH